MLAIYCLKNINRKKTMYKSTYRYNAFCAKCQKNDSVFLYMLVVTKKRWEYT